MKTILCDLCAKNFLCRKKYLKKDKCPFYSAEIGETSYLLKQRIIYKDANPSCPRCGSSKYVIKTYSDRFKCLNPECHGKIFS